MKSIRSLLVLPLVSGSRGCRRDTPRDFGAGLAAALGAAWLVEIAEGAKAKGVAC